MLHSDTAAPLDTSQDCVSMYQQSLKRDRHSQCQSLGEKTAPQNGNLATFSIMQQQTPTNRTCSTGGCISPFVEDWSYTGSPIVGLIVSCN